MDDKIKALSAPIGTTLDRCIDLNQDEFLYATGELSRLLRDIGLAAKILGREINRAGLAGLGGLAGSENVQGEDQKMLDVVGHIRFVRALKMGGQVCCIVSEEKEELVLTDKNDAKYVIAMDPLDGSSNIEVNVPIGTVFGIFRRKTEVGTTPTVEQDALQAGHEQVAAGYVLFGSSTMLVYTTDYGVNGFTYDHSLGEFYLSHPKMKFPEEGDIYSINESHYFKYGEAIQHYLNHCKREGYTARYIGSLVADFHRSLIKGGIYLYPATPGVYPDGKLRLLYECNPLA
ncbi:MAG: class 1 fructose-bisphosphatase, partial [Mameliella sp.]|nr:class 1 fructose-bisphosphatase [Phaeodactylibacter sp.]